MYIVQESKYQILWLLLLLALRYAQKHDIDIEKKLVLRGHTNNVIPTIDTDQEYIYLIGSEMLSSGSYVHLRKTIIPISNMV